MDPSRTSNRATWPELRARRSSSLPLRGAALLLQLHAAIRRLAGAPLDLLLRLWLAQGFVISGVLKLSDWNTALTLATYEYPVSWMSPFSAALSGLLIELLGGLLLALGLLTRPAALALAALLLVVQSVYLPLNSHLYAVLLLGWFAAAGAGGLSLDHLLGKGVGDSALPGGHALQRLYALVDRWLAPLYHALLRLALASVLLCAAGWMRPQVLLSLSFQPEVLHGLLQRTALVDIGGTAPLMTTAALPAVVLQLLPVCGLLLACGLATRLAALLLGGLLLALALSGTHTALQSAELTGLAALAGLLLVHGGGPLSLDAMLLRWTRQVLARTRSALGELPHVVVVGAGFGGLACVSGLRHAPCRITLIDQHNYHLFQPLLYQVATAGLSPADIATPIRAQLREQANVTVRMARVSGIDTQNRELLLGDNRLNYDCLVLATGAQHSYFGKDHWERFAPGLKRIEDSVEVRRRLLLAFEQAENTSDPQQRAALLRFVVVGGGPTGVELAGAIAELAAHGMQGEFREIDPASAEVILVQSADRLLPSFAPACSSATLDSLRALGVQVRLSSRVQEIDAAGVVVNGERIAARTVLWAAGVAASPAAQWLGVAHDAAGRVLVAADLSVPGLTGVYALGDTAASNAWKRQAVPGLAPAAKQGGAYVARLIRAQLAGKPAPPPFAYTHMGSLATIGRKSAVADFGFLRLRGPIAWWFWGAVHVLFLASMRSRIAVAMEWLWAYLTFRRNTRLITGKLE